MFQGGFQHFHLDLSARSLLQDKNVYEKYRPWLFKLHCAFMVLKDLETELNNFETRLESARRESNPANASILVNALGDFQALKYAYSEQLKIAIAEVCANAIEKVTFPPASLPALIWNYDPNNPSTLRLFNGAVQDSPLKYKFSIELGSLRDFSREYVDEKEKVEELQRKVREKEQEIERLRTRLQEITAESESRKARVTELEQRLKESDVPEILVSQILQPPKGIPYYKMLKPGFSIISYCKNETCSAYYDAFYICKGFGKFDYAREKNRMVCPECSGKTDVIVDCGFYKTRWKMESVTSEGVAQTREHYTDSDTFEIVQDINNRNWRFIEFIASSL